MKHPAGSLLPLISFLVLLPACKLSDEYDLEHLDKTVNVLKGLQVPVGSLQQIRLADFIKLGESGEITMAENGDYQFDFQLDPINFTFHVPSIDIPENSGEDIKLFNGNVVLPTGSWSNPVEDVSGSYTYSFDWTWDGLPEEVTAVRSIHVRPTPVRLSLDVRGLPFSQCVLLKKGKDSASESRIVFPDWIHFVSCDTEGFQLVDGHTLKPTADRTIRYGEPLTIVCTVDGVENLTAQDCSISKGSVSVFGKVELFGTLSVREQDLTATVTGPLTCEVNNVLEYGSTPVQDATVQLVLGDDFKKDVQYSVTGFSISGDSEWKLVFSDISLDLTAENGLPAGLALKGGFETSGNGTVAHTYPVEETFPSGKTVKLRYNETGSGPDSGFTYRKMEQLGSLLSPAPESIRLFVDRIGLTDEWTTLSFGRDYALSCQVGFHAPFAFASGSELRMTQEIKDLTINVGEGVAVDRATILFDVVNTIPLEMSVQTTALDGDGKPLNDLSVSEVRLAPGDLRNPATTPVAIGLEARSVGKLSSIRLTFNARVDEKLAGVPLNGNQGLKINGILLRMDSGVTARIDQIAN